MKFAAGIYLLNSENKILICHPTNAKKDFWSIPKGLVGSGENYWDAAKREMLEETNIDITKYKFLPKELPVRYYKTLKKCLNSFLVKIDSDFKDENIYCPSMVVKNGKELYPELDEHKWVTLKAAKKVLHDSQKENIELIERMIKEFNL